MTSEKQLSYKPPEYPAVSLGQSPLTSPFNEFLYAVRFGTADIFVQIQPFPFSASFSRSPTALNSFFFILLFFYRIARSPLAVLSFRPLGSTGIALRRHAFTSHLQHSGLNYWILFRFDTVTSNCRCRIFSLKFNILHLKCNRIASGQYVYVCLWTCVLFV